MSLNHILFGGTWEPLPLGSRALLAIQRNCYVQQSFNSWWKTSDERTQTFLFPFLFIYLFIYLFIVWVQFSVHRCFGLHWKPQEYFWVLNFAHHSCPFKSVSPPPHPRLGIREKDFISTFFLYSKLSVLNPLKWDLYVLLVGLKSVIYTPTLVKRPKRSSRSSAHRHWRPFS